MYPSTEFYASKRNSIPNLIPNIYTPRWIYGAHIKGSVDALLMKSG